MSMREIRRDRIMELRVQERDMVKAIEDLTRALEENRAEQKRENSSLLREAKQELRVPAIVTAQAGRATLAKLRVFTLGNAQAKLGWKRSDVKKLIDVMLCEQPPTLELTERFEGGQAYRYVGPPVNPEAVRDAGEYETIKEWALSRTEPFSPGQCTMACNVTRAVAMRALNHLTDLGRLVNEGPTADFPLFIVAGTNTPEEVAPLALRAVPSPEPKVFSKVPEIQAMLAAADAAGLEVTPSDNHFAIEGPTNRIVIRAKPEGRQRMLETKAALRRMGAKL